MHRNRSRTAALFLAGAVALLGTTACGSSAAKPASTTTSTTSPVKTSSSDGSVNAPENSTMATGSPAGDVGGSLIPNGG